MLVFDINEKPLYMYNSDAVDSFTYIRLDGEQLDVGVDVKYSEGIDSLISYLNYYYFKDYYKDEVNSLLVFCILFNDKLDIQEIRISKRLGIKTDKYDDLILKSLLLTKGKWIKTKPSPKKWYLYIGRYKLI
ncbi:hypothetical protein LJC12_03625 [Odoribacter sp. OttesenSCG-928-J03]|nr:hypothetical protein [Odoribacter sp. OttesenSCG-928-J03]